MTTEPKSGDAPSAPESAPNEAPSEADPEAAVREATSEWSARREDLINAKPRRKKGAKKKPERAPESSASDERPALDAQGRERPAFLLRFPADPELERLIAAFESGNYRRVREEAPRLLANSARADVRAAAEELLRRIEPDPLMKVLLAAAIALFFAVVGYVYYAHG